MNTFNPKKLLNSKWTAVTPVKKQKHFLITELELDEDGAVESCTLEAVLTKESKLIDWRALKDPERWLQGWK